MLDDCVMFNGYSSNIPAVVLHPSGRGAAVNRSTRILIIVVTP